MCKLNTNKNIPRTKIKIFHLFIFLITFNLLISKSFSLCLSSQYKMTIVNDLPMDSKYVKFQCYGSDGTDLGLQTLRTFKRFEWTICTSLFTETRYYCTFHWRQQKATALFDVFNADLSAQCVDYVFGPSACQWTISQYGFYFGVEWPYTLREDWKRHH
ncbi:hypothetical protein ABFS82_08G233500 [Erythranthe guttata]